MIARTRVETIGRCLPPESGKFCTLFCKQHAHTVGLDQEPGSQSMPSLLSLDELRREAMPMKGCGCGETGYSSADDQDRLDLCHIPSDRDGPDRHCAARKRVAASTPPIMDPAEQ